jgi:hypothetical protein
MKAYKIVEHYKGGIRTLFHGTHGSRHLPINVWIDAQIRESAKDGTSKSTYKSGFHSIPTLKECRDYLSQFKTRLDDLVIVEVEVGNETWGKKHSPSNIILSSKIKITKIL